MNTTLAEIRRKNLQLLIDSKFRGRQIGLSHASGISLSQIGQWLSGVRNLSERSARSIENLCGVSQGLLDHNPEGGLHPDIAEAFETNQRTEAELSAKIPEDQRSLITISNNEEGLAQGYGAYVTPSDKKIESIKVTKVWLRGTFPSLSSIHNVCLMGAYGDSMAPTIEDGDVLMVDRGINTFQEDGLYVLAMAGYLFIRRLQRKLDGSVSIKADNPLYDSVTAASEGLTDVGIQGKVLMKLSTTKL